MEEPIKHCRKCDEDKPVHEFNKDKGRKDGLSFYCTLCVRAAARSWGKANPEKVRSNNRKKYAEGGPERYRRYYLKRVYGISSDDYLQILEAQGGKCAICGATEPGAGRKYFPVDHCHASGRVRGLLCHHCNLALGHFKDDAERLSSALLYLEHNE